MCPCIFIRDSRHTKQTGVGVKVTAPLMARFYEDLLTDFGGLHGEIFAGLQTGRAREDGGAARLVTWARHALFLLGARGAVAPFRSVGLCAYRNSPYVRQWGEKKGHMK
jgi:hypothetical protein